MEVQELVPATAQFTFEVQITFKTAMNQLDNFKTILSSLNILPVDSEYSEAPLASYKAPMFVPQVWIEFEQFWQPPNLLGVVVINIKPWGDSQGMGAFQDNLCLFLTTFYYLESPWNIVKFFFISTLFMSTFKLLQVQFFPVLVCKFLKEQSLKKEAILGPCLVKD